MEQVILSARFCTYCGKTVQSESVNFKECCSRKTKRCQIRVWLGRKDAKIWGD